MEKELTFTLSIQEANTVLAALQELPAKVANPAASTAAAAQRRTSRTIKKSPVEQSTGLFCFYSGVSWSLSSTSTVLSSSILSNSLNTFISISRYGWSTWCRSTKYTSR
jgi:hypothetical protein